MGRWGAVCGVCANLFGDACGVLCVVWTAAMVIYATFLDVLHPKLAFPAGLLVCRQLVNDYKCGLVLCSPVVRAVHSPPLVPCLAWILSC
jgi:hypothetical protein